MWRVDQVFLTRRGGRIEVIASMVGGGGDLRNLPLLAPTEDPVAAVRYAAAHLAGRGDVSGARGARVRWSRHQAASEQNALLPGLVLEDEFLDAFEEALSRLRDQQR